MPRKEEGKKRRYDVYVYTNIYLYIYIQDCTDMFIHMHAQYVYQKDDTLL